MCFFGYHSYISTTFALRTYFFLKYNQTPCLRAVALFALARQNVEKKLKSESKQKDSEILASVSKEIHIQMENIKPHVLTDRNHIKVKLECDS